MAVFVPTSDEISGRRAFDDLEDIKINLFQSMLNFQVPTQYDSNERFRVTFVKSEVNLYNTAYIVGLFSFQTLQDITYYDTIRQRSFFPVRDIDYTMGIDFDGSNGDDLIFSIDLDDNPDF